MNVARPLAEGERARAARKVCGYLPEIARFHRRRAVVRLGEKPVFGERQQFFFPVKQREVSRFRLDGERQLIDGLLQPAAEYERFRRARQFHAVRSHLVLRFHGAEIRGQADVFHAAEGAAQHVRSGLSRAAAGRDGEGFRPFARRGGKDTGLRRQRIQIGRLDGEFIIFRVVGELIGGKRRVAVLHRNGFALRVKEEIHVRAAGGLSADVAASVLDLFADEEHQLFGAFPALDHEGVFSLYEGVQRGLADDENAVFRRIIARSQRRRADGDRIDASRPLVGDDEILRVVPVIELQRAQDFKGRVGRLGVGSRPRVRGFFAGSQAA